MDQYIPHAFLGIDYNNGCNLDTIVSFKDMMCMSPHWFSTNVLGI